jgi:hypothetical protein
MIIDISALLDFANPLRWVGSTAVDVAAGIASGRGLSVDHDEGSGENWIRLIHENSVLVLIHVAYPLVVASPSIKVAAPSSGPLVLLYVDLSARCLTAHDRAIEAAFPGRSSSVALEGTFSAHDLWFATV